MKLPAILIGVAVLLAAGYAYGANLVISADVVNLPPEVKQVDVSTTNILPGGGTVTVKAILSDQNSLSDLSTKQCLVAHQSDVASTIEATVWHSVVNMQPSNPSLDPEQNVQAEYNCTITFAPSDERGDYVVLVRAIDTAGTDARWFRIVSYASAFDTLWVQDMDGDGYTLNTGAVISDTSPGVGYKKLADSLGVDCYDKNSQAYPGQTKYFQVNRGDGSFDYNCNGMQDMLVKNTVLTCLLAPRNASTWCTFGTNAPGCGAKGSMTTGPTGPLGWCSCAPAVQTCR